MVEQDDETYAANVCISCHVSCLSINKLSVHKEVVGAHLYQELVDQFFPVETIIDVGEDPTLVDQGECIQVENALDLKPRQSWKSNDNNRKC